MAAKRIICKGSFGRDSGPELSERFGSHCSILISGEMSTDQSLSALFSGEICMGYGPMALKVRRKLPPRLVWVHGWLFHHIKKPPQAENVLNSLFS